MKNRGKSVNQYYASLLKEIAELISREEYEKAEALIRPELELPYVPAEAREVLESYAADLKSILMPVKNRSRLDIETLINGSIEQKETAASILQERNLRQYIPEVQKLLLDSQLVPEFKGELIEALMEQRVDENLQLLRKNEKITFSPADIVPRDQDPVYIETRKLLDEWLSCINPVMADFCIQMLDQEVLDRRPDDLSGIQARELAASIARLVFDAMQDEDGWNQLKDTQNLTDENCCQLYIQERGE